MAKSRTRVKHKTPIQVALGGHEVPVATRENGRNGPRRGKQNSPHPINLFLTGEAKPTRRRTFYARVDVITGEPGVVFLECVEENWINAFAARADRSVESTLRALASAPVSLIQTSSTALAPWLRGERAEEGAIPLHRTFWFRQWLSLMDALPGLNEEERERLVSGYMPMWSARMDSVQRRIGQPSDTIRPSWVRITLAAGAPTPGDLPAFQYFSLFNPASPRAITSITPVADGSAAKEALEDSVGWLTQYVATAGQLRRVLTPPTLTAVRVFDVGQGNCNALLGDDGSVALYYDFGRGIWPNNATYPIQMTHACTANTPPVVLSHWDWDHWAMVQHFHELLDSKWVVPNQKLGLMHAALAAALAERGNLLVWPNQPLLKFGGLTVFKCDGGARVKDERNETGLAMSIADPGGSGRLVVLPGDARLDLFTHGTSTDVAAFVAPHHGAHMPPNPCPPAAHAAYHRVAISCATTKRPNHPRQVALDAFVAQGWIQQRRTNGQIPRLGHIDLFWNPGRVLNPIPCTPRRPCHAVRCALKGAQT